MDEPLITILTPVFNGEAYVRHAWNCVMDQTWQHWEWLIIDNNSTDQGVGWLREMAAGDDRIRFYEQSRQGAGAARNTALVDMQGEFLCFLDVDDGIPPHSLASRARHLMAHPALDVVDGKVRRYNADMSAVVDEWKPNFRGDAFPEVLRLNSDCFFGLSWMIRRRAFEGVLFADHMSHCEDLLFYLSLGPVQYDHVDEWVLEYRTGNESLMSDLVGLERSYRQVVQWVVGHAALDVVTREQFRSRVRRIMIRSWLKQGKPIRALSCAVRRW